MAYKLIAFACLVAAASAGILPVAQYAAPVKYVQPEVYAPAEYNFQYSVHDGHTGDAKSQQEQRHGDDVQGSYSLLEADGTTRIVEYTASEKDGFNAVVRHEGHPAPAHIAKVAYAAPVAKVAYAAPVAKVAYAAPIQQHYAAPVQHYAAPVAKVAYAAPVASVSYSSPIASYHH